MSLTATSGRQSWRDFLESVGDRDMTIEKAHDLARTFLLQEGLDLSAYSIDAYSHDRGREGRVRISITPRPVLPSFGAEWDNNWNRS